MPEIAAGQTELPSGQLNFYEFQNQLDGSASIIRNVHGSAIGKYLKIKRIWNGIQTAFTVAASDAQFACFGIFESRVALMGRVRS
jgi:hypothetical protein